MNYDRTQLQEIANSTDSLQTTSATLISVTLVGFVLFLTGILLFVVVTVDAFSSMEGLRTLAGFVLGMACYKLGQFILNQCSTLRYRNGNGRRRQLIV